jgi:hypothetical protein
MVRRSEYFVVWLNEAVDEINEIKQQQLMRDVLKSADQLKRSGPLLVEPHSKPVKGTRRLRELRPKGGRSTVRLLYAKVGINTFAILGIAVEVKVPAKFNSAIAKARRRAKEHYGIEI